MKLLLALMLVLPLVPVSGASYGPCEGPQPSLGIIQVTGGTAETTFYIDDRSYAFGNGLWEYEETNGVWQAKLPGVYVGDAGHADLQRGGTPPWSDENDPCVDDPNVIPDAIIF